jgi:hypothetical protein
LESVHEADESRRKKGGDRAKTPAQTPVTDVDCKVLPNKDGGFAPNYTPMATRDGHCGLVVDADVVNDSSEGPVALAAVDRIEQDLGKVPERVYADGAYGTGQNLAGMEDRKVELLTPVESSQPKEGDAAYRCDPVIPVAEDQRDKLPMRGKPQKLDRSAFIYDEDSDCYYCPEGKRLNYEKTKRKDRLGGPVAVRVYRCDQCADCPLAAKCLSQGAHGRTIERDPYEDHRNRAAARMASEQNQLLYKKRLPLAETVFGHIKATMGVRQFLLRGLENVQTEWLWICTAFNLDKLTREIARLRARLAIPTL